MSKRLRSCHPWRSSIVLGAVVLAGLALVSPAGAHSFLIRSDPEAGARLASSPSTMNLYFSESFVAGSERIVMSRPGGGEVSLAKPQGSGSLVTQPLPKRLKGVFVVHWRVLSDDGHISLGEFAFAVGSGAALPTLKASSQGTSWSEVVASWLVFIGLALALGGLLSDRFVWRRTPDQGTVAAAPVAVGVALALGGALLELALLAGNQRGGGLATGLHGGALVDALATRPGRLTLAILIALGVAGGLTFLGWLRLAAIVPLLAAVGFVAARGHSGTSGHVWAAVADFVHLAAVAAWVGALVHLVLIVARAQEPRAALAGGVARYARFALPTVLVILASGVLTAIPEFRSLGSVFSSGYGRTLLVKSGLIGIALLLALAARTRALPSRPPPLPLPLLGRVFPANPRLRLPLLRRLTLTESTTVLVVLVAAAVLANAAPPRGPAAAAIPVLGPPPVSGASVRLADLAGQLAVGLTAGAKELQFTIIAPGQAPLQQAKLTADAEPARGKPLDLYPRPCGNGCFVIRHRLRGETVITADVSARDWTGGKVRFTVPWPLRPPADAALRRVTRTMKAVPRLLLTESVTSGFGKGARPNGYTLSGKAFVATELYGGGAVDVRELGRTGGLTELAFAFPGSSIWYRIWFDARYRLRRELIVSPGHLIRRSFRYGVAAGGSAAPPTPTPTGAVPTPPAGAVVFGQEDGDLAVGLAIKLRPARLELQATVLGPDGGGLSGLRVGYSARSSDGERSASATECGSGCYRAELAATGAPELVRVQLAGSGRAASSLSFPLPHPWPPPATALAARATRVFRHLRSVVIHERLASSPTNVLLTTYELAAPNRLAYHTKGGSEAVVIGDRRWDRDPGSAWKESSQSPLRQPTPFWSSVTDAHVIATTRIDGRPAWLVSFYEAHIPAFFTIAIDKRTLRTLDLRMTAAAHFMHHRYGGFNRPLDVKPPR